MNISVLQRSLLLAVTLVPVRSSAPAAPGPDVQVPRLAGGFTLVFRVIHTSDVTPQDTKRLLDFNAKYYAELVRQGKMTSQDMQRNLASIRATQQEQPKVYQAEVDMSERGGRFLYSYREVDGASPVAIAVVYNGRDSWYTQEVGRGPVRLARTAGIATKWMRDVPFPAVNLPWLTFVKVPDALSANGGSARADVIFGPNTDRFVFLPGQIDYRVVGGRVQVTRARSTYNGHVTAAWSFSGFRQLNGVWIASTIDLDARMLDGSPNASIRYALVSASPHPLAAHLFELAGNLRANDVVDLGGKSFAYDPRGGSLESQARRAAGEVAMAHHLADDGRVGTKVAIGALLLAACVLTALGIGIARRARLFHR